MITVEQEIKLKELFKRYENDLRFDEEQHTEHKLKATYGLGVSEGKVYAMRDIKEILGWK